ncbi:class I adenylate-forming enzyme family protein [Streptomyces silvisoli]|uniref:Class I adenylate-forming enzyme family protein n=1 Tax=Streptomyces silvisoli TaxID=3034235 RepID=A0ABT5ZS43_9ACTN|nr:class I adenylate-forming enzyme family protein [Streptomyces silvisoli]MDF3292654.1 class I adenylate-forming enzyme family protein [Streptomyces silvisoli]
MNDLLVAMERHAAERPDAVAVRAFSRGAWTDTSWRQLVTLVQKAASGVRLPREHARVLLVLDNSAHAVAVLLGLLRAGADVICVERDNSHLGDPRSVLRQVDVGALIMCDDAGHPTGSASADLPFARYSYADLLSGPQEETSRPATAGTATVHQLTSGSTGEPRIVRHTAASIGRGGAIYQEIFDYQPVDRILLTVPQAHSFGMVGGVVAGLLSGAGIVLLDTFSLTAVHSALADGVTVMLGTPLVYRLLAAAPPPPDHQLRLALSSGGPLSADLADAAERTLGLRVSQVYGSTETGIIAFQPPRAEPWPAQAVGIAAPGVTWQARPEGLVVTTSTMFTGYLEPGGVTPSGAADGYAIGDLARIDEGVLYLTGRKDTFINVGGRKVNPARVGRIVLAHPAVRDVHVFALDSPSGEQEVHAAVVAPAEDAARITAHCRDRLARYEVPRVHFVTRLPRSALGKVDLSRLLAELPSAAPSRLPETP